LTDILTVGTEETSIVIDALNAFSTNLKDESADRVVQRVEQILKTTAFKSSTKTGLNQEQIYRYSADQQEYVRMLNEASDQHLAVRIGYRSPRGAEQIFTGYPLWKLFHERGWYYINRRSDSEAFFSWRLDRIIDCEILNNEHANANYKDDLKTAKYLIKNGWGMSFPSQTSELQTQNLILITVRFDATAAGFIKEGTDRHPRASIKDCTEEQGSIDFQIKLPKQCHSEFRNWVRSWGAKARFISPDSFIERERTELRELLNKYES
jgi:predicted DNA-binding transcriptional regulator YafY